MTIHDFIQCLTISCTDTISFKVLNVGFICCLERFHIVSRMNICVTNDYLCLEWLFVSRMTIGVTDDYLCHGWLFVLHSVLHNYYLRFHTVTRFHIPPMNGIIALWTATNRWYVVKYVSQQRNRSNNKNEWYNILVSFIFKFSWGLY